MRRPKDERYVYVATFSRPLRFAADDTLTFCNSDIRMARDHAEYVAWHDNVRVLYLRRATAEEEAAFRNET